MPSTTTSPLMTLVSEFHEPIPGVKKSTSIAEGVEKAEKQGPGTYWLLRPPVKIVIRDTKRKVKTKTKSAK